MIYSYSAVVIFKMWAFCFFKLKFMVATLYKHQKFIYLLHCYLCTACFLTKLSHCYILLILTWNTWYLNNSISFLFHKYQRIHKYQEKKKVLRINPWKKELDGFFEVMLHLTNLVFKTWLEDDNQHCSCRILTTCRYCLLKILDQL